MVITITNTGYIKSLPLATYRQQQRGGRGVTGMDMKDGDFIEHLFVCSSHDYLLFFSNRGKVYRSKVYELPEASRTAKGRALVNVLPLREGERIQAVLSTRDFGETKYLVFATRGGTVKKTELLAYNTPIKADGIIAINIRDDDELLAVRAVDPEDEIIMVSRAGLTVRFAESDVRAMGRDTTGVRGMDVGKDGQVIAMDVARDDMDLLVVTENGYGKRSQISQYRKTNRGAKGVKTIGLTEKKGGLAGALVVRDHQELVFISVGGMVQRTSAAGISRQGRSATGVRVMNLKEDDLVSAVALVVDTEGQDDAEDGLAPGRRAPALARGQRAAAQRILTARPQPSRSSRPRSDRSVQRSKRSGCKNSAPASRRVARSSGPWRSASSSAPPQSRREPTGRRSQPQLAAPVAHRASRESKGRPGAGARARGRCTATRASRRTARASRRETRETAALSRAGSSSPFSRSPRVTRPRAAPRARGDDRRGARDSLPEHRNSCPRRRTWNSCARPSCA